MRILTISITLLALLFCTGCPKKDFIKPDRDRIDEYIKTHPDLPEYDQRCIYDGIFEIGIKLETLKFLLGEPRVIETVKQPWAIQQKWIYNRRGQKIFIIEDQHVVGILERDK